MKRAAHIYSRTVVPAITQVPASFGDVALQAKAAIQQTWEDRNVDHQVISPGSLYDTPTTTTTTTSFDFSYIHDTGTISQRVDDVFDNLPVDRAHPTSVALAQVVRDTARDPQIVQRITGLDSFHKFVNILNVIPPNFNTISSTLGSRRLSNGFEVENRVPMSTMGTQTDDLDFLFNIESLDRITEQIAPDFGILPTSPFTALSPTPSETITSTTSTTSTSSISSSSSVSSSSSIHSSSSIDPISTSASDPSESESYGHAGYPGQTNTNMERAMKVVIPLTIIAVAAAVTKMSLSSAVDLLHAGFKFVLKLLVRQPQ